MSALEAAMLRYRPRTIPLLGKQPATGEGWLRWEPTPENIVAWLAEHGHRNDANVGIRTGNRLVVLDVDPRHGGDLTLSRLEREHGSLPATPEVVTGRGDGGRHLYFRSAPDLQSRDLKDDGLHGLEIKARGCQVVAPPSIHPDTGREYVWHPARPLIEAEIAQLPHWLASLAGGDRSNDTTRDLADLAARDPLHSIPSTVYVPRLTGREINHAGFVRCPFHKDGQERRPALKVYPQGGWKCHACGIGGRIYQLAGLLGGYDLPLSPDARRVIRAALISEFAVELAA